MQKLLIFSLVGFIAEIIDGSLGMAFGVTSSSLLLMFGVAPAVASASIHISEIATTAASGTSHWKFGNIDKSLMIRLMIPGTITAFIGAAFLSNLNTAIIKPFIHLFLLTMGIYIIYRFLFKLHSSQETAKRKLPNIFLIPLGAIAGFFDAVGGGGWGPINTPILMSKKGLSTRKVVGSVSASEFAITLSGSLGFFIFLGWEQINWLWVGGFAFGGVLAAPFGAWLVKVIPTHLLGVLVGGLIIVTNIGTLVSMYVHKENIEYVVYAGLIPLWAGLIFYANYRRRKLNAESQNFTDV